MSKIEVNQISSQCGSTLTIGQSGDTVTLACGASQTGFGRTGTVNWNTTAITADPNPAVSGTGYFVNTTSGAITITLPTSPSAGDIVAFADYALTWDTNNLTLDPGSNKINGSTDDYIVSSEGKSLTLVYTDSTQGWKVVNDGNSDAGAQAQYIVATGGTVTCCGDYKIHTFTGPGTFTVCSVGNPAGSTTVDYLVVAGGGSGGGYGGGGAGGFRESDGTASGCYTTSPLGACVAALPVSAQGYPITVGGGGPTGGGTGNPSTFSTITSAGGGTNTGPTCSSAGGSGGGGGHSGCGAAGNTPPVSPPQGNPGGNSGPVQFVGGGGGGATQAGSTSSSPSTPASGGDGATTSISGSPTAYAGGGGGGAFPPFPDLSPTGGLGGGGNGGYGAACVPTRLGTSGTVNTGGGGGASPPNAPVKGGGGSGIVIIRYKYQ